jgi:heme exporter protein D
MNDFFAMGGYGFYVWGSYAVTAVALALEVMMLMKRARKSEAQA